MVFLIYAHTKKLGMLMIVRVRLVRELMYLTMPEAETSEDKMYGVTWYTVIKAWNLEPSEDYHLYKRYFNGCVDTDLKNIKEVKKLKENKRAS